MSAEPMSADPMPVEVAAPPAASSTEVAPSPEPSVPVRRRSTVALVVVRRVLGFALSVALLVGGVLLGYQAFLGNQPPAATAGDPATDGVPTPPVVVELVNAIAGNDADAIRAALGPEQFARYTAEMERWSFATVTSAESLATYQDGPRTATALVIQGRSADRNPLAINLIVLTEGGQIASFR